MSVLTLGQHGCQNSQMDLKQLRNFVGIVDCGSVTKAAKQLFIAQPALSQQLAKLEEEVGVSLLVRSTRGVTPTENGLALYHHARLMLRQMDQALSIVRKESGHIRGMVSIGLSPSTLGPLGLPLVQTIRSKYPNILLNVVEGLSGHLCQMLRRQQLDLAILFSNELMGADFNADALLDEELFLVLPAGSSLVDAQRTGITVQEAARLPLILPTMAHGMRRRVAVELEQRNLQANVLAEIDSVLLLLRCVQAGMGATIEPLSALQSGDLGMDTRWRVLPFTDVTLSRRSYLYSARAEIDNSAISAVAHELRSTVARLVQEDQWPGAQLVNGSVTANEDTGHFSREVNVPLPMKRGRGRKKG